MSANEPEDALSPQQPRTHQYLLPLLLGVQPNHVLFSSAAGLSQTLEYFFQLHHLRRLREALGDRIEHLQALAEERRYQHMETSSLEDLLLRRAMLASLEHPQPCGPPPATKEDIANLSAFKLTAADLSQPEAARDCCICLEKLSPGADATRLPCKHIFCPDCIKTWLQSHGTCPTCRQAVKDVPKGVAGRPDAAAAEQAEAAAEPEEVPPPAPMSGAPVHGLMHRIRERRRSSLAAVARVYSSGSDDDGSDDDGSDGGAVEVRPPPQRRIRSGRLTAGRAAADEPVPPAVSRRDRPAPRGPSEAAAAAAAVAETAAARRLSAARPTPADAEAAARRSQPAAAAVAEPRREPARPAAPPAAAPDAAARRGQPEQGRAAAQQWGRRPQQAEEATERPAAPMRGGIAGRRRNPVDVGTAWGRGGTAGLGGQWRRQDRRRGD